MTEHSILLGSITACATCGKLTRLTLDGTPCCVACFVDMCVGRRLLLITPPDVSTIEVEW